MATLSLLFMCAIIAHKVESRNFYAYSYDEIVSKLEKWHTEYGSTIFKLYTAKEKYNIHFSEADKMHKYEHHIIVITNHQTWASDPARPHIFLSGALHGNERVGPTTLTELCDYLLFEYDKKDKDKNEWIHYLINNRVIIMTPMSNSEGYALSKREEHSIDPNRDFPYMIEDSHNCMKTLTARVINEIFREYLIQLSMTFHGGMRAISYEWGAPNHRTPKDFSPDHIAQLEMAQMMQILGGGHYHYPIGTLNAVVYPVKGGMEDWAYAGSWDETNVIQCTPQTYNGYPKNKTVYNSAMLRAFNFLIEASAKKGPVTKWGNIRNDWNDIWSIDHSDFDGHIPRNIRISLYVINSAAPYVIIRKCPKYISVNSEKRLGIIHWFVSGAVSLYDYDLLFAMENGGNAEDSIKWEILKFEKNPLWRKNLDLEIDKNQNKIFKFSIEIETKLTNALMEQIILKCKESQMSDNCPIWFSIRVRVDDQWQSNTDLRNFKTIKTFPNGIGPQSHIVNARNKNPSQWNMTNNKYFVKASQWWYAIENVKINIQIKDDNGNGMVGQIKQESNNEKPFIIILILCVVIGVAIFIYRKKRNKDRRIYGNKTYQRVSTISIV